MWRKSDIDKGSIDKALLVSIVLVALIGILSIYSATWTFAGRSIGLDPLVVKQCIWVFVGIVIMLIIAKADYIKILDYAYFIYFLNIIVLLLLLFFGGERYGARRWISIGPFSFQPSEFMKITVILVLAAFLGERREKIGTLGNFISSFLVIAPAGVLIFLQPDLGTAFVFLPILFAILFVAGEKIKYFLITIGMGLISMPLFWHFLKDYQKSRLMVFMNPNLDPLGAGYTIIQSKIAIGSGGFLGKGWLNGTQSYLKFLPERHTDFIFSVIGEEWGFLGTLILVGLYSFIILRGIKIISETDDLYGKCIATGIITLISFQVFVNIAMTVGLMPVVGLPLPAISYGGSNTITSLISAGLLLSVSKRAHSH